MNLLIFLAVLSVLIVVHEWGHFIAARRLGVGVEKFSLGFGPRLCSWRSRGTEFLISAIPLGGYVKLAGDERASCHGRPEEFYSRSAIDRGVIIGMGPIVNFLFAFVCFYIILVTGFPMVANQVGLVMEGYPAHQAGIAVGDRVIAINDRAITNWDQLQATIAESAGRSLTFRIIRGGEERQLVMAPREDRLTNIFGQEEARFVVGLQPAEEVVFVRHGPIKALGQAAAELVKVVGTTLRALYYVVSGAMPAKDALGGPIRIFDVIANAASMGLAYLIFVMAVISASLGLFNLFPIPVLDGGHLFLLFLEGLRRRPLPEKIEENFNRVGFALLMCLMVFVFYNDLAEMGWIDKATGMVQRLWAK